MKLSSLTDEFLDFLELNKKSSHTLKDYRYYLSKFNEFHKDQKFPEVTYQLIEQYHKFLNGQTDEDGKKLKPSTKNYFLIALRSFFNYLEQEKGLSIYSPEKIRLHSLKRSQPEGLDHGVLQKLVNSTDLSSKEGLRDRLVMDILNLSGLKVSELASLNRDAVNLNFGHLDFTDKHGIKKGFNIPSPTLEVLVKYFVQRRDSFKPLFIRFKGKVDQSDSGEKMRLSPRSIERLIEKYVKKVGLNFKVTPLSLRHNFAYKELESGKDLENLRLSLGHLSKNSTRIYTQKKSAQ